MNHPAPAGCRWQPRQGLVFIGHVTIDDIKTTEGSSSGVPEGAPFFGALASIKMETPGPFRGSLDDVLTRMR